MLIFFSAGLSYGCLINIYTSTNLKSSGCSHVHLQKKVFSHDVAETCATRGDLIHECHCCESYY